MMGFVQNCEEVIWKHVSKPAWLINRGGVGCLVVIVYNLLSPTMSSVEFHICFVVSARVCMCAEFKRDQS